MDSLDPNAIKQHAERHFAPSRMVSDYLAAYAIVGRNADEPVALSA